MLELVQQVRSEHVDEMFTSSLQMKANCTHHLEILWVEEIALAKKLYLHHYSVGLNQSKNSAVPMLHFSWQHGMFSPQMEMEISLMIDKVETTKSDG